MATLVIEAVDVVQFAEALKRRALPIGVFPREWYHRSHRDKLEWYGLPHGAQLSEDQAIHPIERKQREQQQQMAALGSALGVGNGLNGGRGSNGRDNGLDDRGRRRRVPGERGRGRGSDLDLDSDADAGVDGRHSSLGANTTRTVGTGDAIDIIGLVCPRVRHIAGSISLAIVSLNAAFKAKHQISARKMNEITEQSPSVMALRKIFSRKLHTWNMDRVESHTAESLAPPRPDDLTTIPNKAMALRDCGVDGGIPDDITQLSVIIPTVIGGAHQYYICRCTCAAGVFDTIFYVDDIYDFFTRYPGAGKCADVAVAYGRSLTLLANNDGKVRNGQMTLDGESWMAAALELVKSEAATSAAAPGPAPAVAPNVNESITFVGSTLPAPAAAPAAVPVPPAPAQATSGPVNSGPATPTAYATHQATLPSPTTPAVSAPALLTDRLERVFQATRAMANQSRSMWLAGARTLAN